MMSDLFATIFSGVTVFVLGQIFVKMFIEPVQEIKKTIAKIRMDIHRYGHIIHNYNNIDENIRNETSAILRNLSAELIAHLELIPFFSFASKIFKFPKPENIKKASINLIALSNWMLYPNNTNKGKDKYGYILENYQNLHDNLGFVIDDASRLDKETLDALKM